MRLLPLGRLFFIIVLLTLIVSACTPAAATAPAASAPATSLPAATMPALPPTWTPTAPVVATTAPTATLTVAAAANPAIAEPASKMQGPLSVILYNIADEAVVSQDKLTLSGEADPETVISVDDQIALAGADRKFALPLTLEEGPNVIEITASDPTGNQGTLYLTIIYDSQP